MVLSTRLERALQQVTTGSLISGSFSELSLQTPNSKATLTSEGSEKSLVAPKTVCHSNWTQHTLPREKLCMNPSTKVECGGHHQRRIWNLILYQCFLSFKNPETGVFLTKGEKTKRVKSLRKAETVKTQHRSSGLDFEPSMRLREPRSKFARNEFVTCVDMSESDTPNRCYSVSQCL